MITLPALTEVWRTFFFAPQDPAPLILFRTAFAIVLLANALLLWREAPLWFGPDGVYPWCHDAAAGPRRFSLFNYLPRRLWIVHALLAVHIAAVLSLMAGVLVAPSAAIACVTLLSFHHRNPGILHGGDAVLRIMTFLLIVAAAESTWGLRLLQLQVAVIYLRAFGSKVNGTAWRDGTAAYYPTEVIEYRRRSLPPLLRQPVLLRAATWGTLGIELSLGTLIWVAELRYYVLAAGVLFHLGLECFLNLQLFGWTMIACLLVFIPPAGARAVLTALGS